ncbi:hypothetical protein PIB30_056573 [Stylosanthes scabra]|uniref:Uncharacterized protein n=1 Tax=Stylosanthes scabra TaxID=79078 RepID=A0ABU6QK44_9FABA|nr:hypothetical protein [Stylosanthes scabra]
MCDSSGRYFLSLIVVVVYASPTIQDASKTHKRNNVAFGIDVEIVKRSSLTLLFITPGTEEDATTDGDGGQKPKGEEKEEEALAWATAAWVEGVGEKERVLGLEFHPLVL